MKIDTKTGKLTVGEFSLIQPQLTKEEFLKSRFAKDSQLVLEHQSYATYRIEIIDGADRFSFSLTFDGQSLNSLQLEQLIGEQSMANWSMEHELNRKKFHDALLVTALGPPPYKFSWGEVASLYDAKSGTSNISIRFN